MCVFTGKVLQCMVTGEELPKDKVVAGHIFKHCWSDLAQPFLNLLHIDCPGNGLLLCKAVENAFDSSEICIIFREDTQG